MKINFLLVVAFIVILYTCKPKETKREKIVEPEKVSCLEVIEKILTTSPYFIEYTATLNDTIIARGGKGVKYFLEGSPDPAYKVKKSNTYDFAVFESYDEQAIIVDHFRFDQRKLQLLKYDSIQNEFIPISYNEKLLKEVQQICNCSYNYFYLSALDVKMYRMNADSRQVEEVKLSDKKILSFAFSPDHRFLAFTKELKDSDIPFSSLVIYDMLKDEIFHEYGGKNGISAIFGNWTSAQTFTYALLNEKKKEYLTFSLRSLKTSEITAKEFYISDSNRNSKLALIEKWKGTKLENMLKKGYDIIENPYDRKWLLLTKKNADFILYNKNKEQYIVLEIENIPTEEIQNIDWLNGMQFIFTRENPSKKNNADIYLYDIENKENRLLVKNVIDITPVYISEI